MAVDPKTLANLKPFVKGQSGNPGGRPVGSRVKLQGKFMNALAEDFEEHGVYAIRAARLEDPMGYIKVVASLMPKEIENKRPIEDLTDDELTAGIAYLRARLAKGAGTGAGQALELQPAGELPTVQ